MHAKRQERIIKPQPAHLKSNKTSPNQKTCNSRVKSACPILGKCLTKSLVYNAEITPTDTHEFMNYIGVTAGTFKERFNNHTKSLNNLACSNETELSKYAWNLKRQNRQYNIRWSIVNCVPACYEVQQGKNTEKKN